MKDFKEKIKSFFGGVMTGMKPDQLPPFVSPFGANAVIDKIAENAGRVRRRKGAVTVTQTPISGEPVVLNIFTYVIDGVIRVLALTDDGGLYVEDLVNVPPLEPVLGAPTYFAPSHFSRSHYADRYFT